MSRSLIVLVCLSFGCTRPAPPPSADTGHAIAADAGARRPPLHPAFEKADLREVMAYFSRGTGVTIDVPSQFSGQLTVHSDVDLDAVEGRAVLQMILGRYGLMLVGENPLWMCLQPTQFAGRPFCPQDGHDYPDKTFPHPDGRLVAEVISGKPERVQSVAAEIQCAPTTHCWRLRDGVLVVIDEPDVVQSVRAKLQ